MRPCVTVEAFASVHIAIERMREAGQELIPIVHDGKLQAVLTETGILKFVAEGASRNDPVSAYGEQAAVILNRASGAEVLRQLEKNHCLVVVDDEFNVCGLVSPSSYVSIPPELARPAMVGGMATPFGVYLTSGSVRGGKDGWNLVATGAFLITPVLLGGKLAEWLSRFVPNTDVWNAILFVISILPMVLLFRIHPIAGFHAAEHQVVHAIERDEEITPEVVSRMPRVHPRCGTNLAVASLIFIAIVYGPWGKEGEPERVFLGLLVTMFLWRSVGAFVQYWVTTKKPSQKQIQSGIEAANELLANYQIAPNRAASPGVRILNSGILHVMAGSAAASVIAELIARMFGSSVIF